MKVSDGITKKYGVYSDDRRHKKPLFESDSASETLQWAINRSTESTIYSSRIPPIEIRTGIELESRSKIFGKRRGSKHGEVSF